MLQLRGRPDPSALEVRFVPDRVRAGLVRVSLLFVLALQAGCTYWVKGRPVTLPSHSLVETEQGVLAQHAEIVERRLAPDESAYWLLSRAPDAFTARVAITDAAVASLDVQYFIWQPDLTGRFLMARLLAAADRGVRVRFLLDDLAAHGLDRELVALDAHPNMEVRVFNPWRHRRWRLVKALEFFGRWGELNHRMHNKIYVADGRVAMLGGRNIGNRYLGFPDILIQNDLDIMFMGPLVKSVATSFDLFWNSDLAYPAQALPVTDAPLLLLEELRLEFAAVIESGREDLGPFDLTQIEVDDYWNERSRDYMDGPGMLHFDLPSIYDTPPEQLYADFLEFIASAQEEVLISSPYFIPDREFIDQLGELESRGVRVAIVTNSLASNNHTMAHTGYRHWRRAVLRQGVELYEYRYDAAAKTEYALDPEQVEVLGLHSKAAVIDGRLVFVGSPNVDPRSMKLNTELGLIVDDEGLAAQVAALIERDMAGENAWQVTLRGRGWLTWTSDEGTLKRQPAAGFRQRGREFFWNLLPIKGQL